MLKKRLAALYADEDSGDAVFSCNEMGILSVYLNNNNLDDANYDKHDHETIIHIRLLVWHIEFEKLKALKKELVRKLMIIA